MAKLPPMPELLEMSGLEKAANMGVTFNPDVGLAGGLTPYRDPSRPGPGCSHTSTGSVADPADFESFIEVLRQGSAGTLRAAASARMLRQEAQRISLLARGAMGALLAAADGPDRLGSSGMAYKPVRSMGLDIMEKGAQSSGLLGSLGGAASTAMGALGSFLDIGPSSPDAVHHPRAEHFEDHGHQAITNGAPSHDHLGQANIAQVPRALPSAFILSAVKGMVKGIVGGLLGGLASTNVRVPRGLESRVSPEDEPIMEGLVFDYRNFRKSPASQRLPDTRTAGEYPQPPGKAQMGDPFAYGAGGLAGQIGAAAGALGFIEVAVSGTVPGWPDPILLEQCKCFL
mmetsp:Transcript_7391/g.13142  ORF Transcript_7391/g.13142 Transcript_7391/m.13142 type:complete len:343 (-) Transcript_7391:29-1057(-)